MKKVQTRVETPQPAEEVYAYLVDFNNQPEWRFDVLSSELVSGERGTVGARYRQKIMQGRRASTSDVELDQAERPAEVSFRTLDSGPVTVSGSWHITSKDQGSEVVCDVIIETSGLMRLVEPMMGPQLRKIAGRYETALAERLATPV